MTLEEFRSEPDRIKAYKEWLSLPMTKAVLGVAKGRVDALFLGQGLPLDPSQGAQIHATTFGRAEILDFIENGITSEVVEHEDPQPTYGADQYLRDHAYIKPNPNSEEA
jgi:hypothetical protein